MSRSRIWLLAFGIAAVVVSTPARAGSLGHVQRTGELEVCVRKNAMPWSRDEESRPGVHVELAESLAAQLGVSLRLSWVSFRWHAKRTRCDAFMGVVNFGGAGEGFLKKSRPYLQVTMRLARIGDGPVPHTLEGLKRYEVAVPSGTLPHYALQKAGVATREKYLTDDAVLDAVQSGAVPLGIVSDAGLGWREAEDQAHSWYSVSSAFIESRDRYAYSVALRRADKALLDAVNRWLDAIEQSGELGAVLERYGIKG